MRRGFKSQCERRSTEARKGFNLPPDAPLCAQQYARDLGIVVWSEAEIDSLPEHDRQQLTCTDSDSWSAFTMRIANNHLVVFNSTQSPPRINSVLMHEVAHITLGHQLTSAALTEEGYFVPTTYNQEEEEEADWLAGTLLLPRPALLKVRRKGFGDQEIRETYKVSQQMLTWRFRMTGVDYQIANAKKR